MMKTETMERLDANQQNLNRLLARLKLDLAMINLEIARQRLIAVHDRIHSRALEIQERRERVQ